MGDLAGCGNHVTSVRIGIVSSCVRDSAAARIPLTALSSPHCRHSVSREKKKKKEKKEKKK